MRVPISLRRGEHRHAVLSVFREEARKNLTLHLTIPTPVRPEKENDDLAFQRVQGGRLRRSKVLGDLDRRRALPFQAEEMNVF